MCAKNFTSGSISLNKSYGRFQFQVKNSSHRTVHTSIKSQKTYMHKLNITYFWCRGVHGSSSLFRFCTLMSVVVVEYFGIRHSATQPGVCKLKGIYINFVTKLICRI
jgi:hypothetical protein